MNDGINFIIFSGIQEMAYALICIEGDKQTKRREYIFIFFVKTQLFISDMILRRMIQFGCSFQSVIKYSPQYISMIQTIWSKEVVAIIEMKIEDVADSCMPLPLLFKMKWNHYIGFYYQDIKHFFMAYAPFPYEEDEFHLSIRSTKQLVQPTTIISHLIFEKALDINEPLYFICSFRIQKKMERQYDLKRFFKNNLKASTALRYGKLGASVLTVKMSTSNVQDMFNHFMQSDYRGYLGSQDYESDDLGYSFLVHTAEKIPIRIMSANFMMERAGEKQMLINDFFQKLFGVQILDKICIKMHGVEIAKDSKVMLQSLQKYCHPDGFLYFHIQ